MKRTCTEADYTWALRPRRLKLPFKYVMWHDSDEAIGFWATTIGVTPARLKRATEALIRNSHHAAVLQSKAIGRQPEIYLLGLGSLQVIYTVESDAVVVRGYSANWPDWQTTEDMEGGYNTDARWSDWPVA